MRACWGLLVCVGCGRVAFDPLGDGGDGDSMTDTVAAQPFCATVQPPPTFCADFDTGALDAGFTTMVLVNGGAVALGDVAHSGAHSLDSSYDPAGNESSYSEAALRFAPSGTWSRVQLDYEVYFATRPTSFGTNELCNLTIGVTGVGTFYQDLTITDGGNGDHFLEELAPFPSGTFMATPLPLNEMVSIGTWRHVRMTLDLAARTHQYEIDGTVFASGATSYAIGPGTVALEAGINYAVNSPSVSRIYVDDVVLRLQ